MTKIRVTKKQYDLLMKQVDPDSPLGLTFEQTEKQKEQSRDGVQRRPQS